MSDKIRKRYVFSGRVQGVGFRFTARNLANLYGLTGWVYNDYDGSVVMEAQGSEENLDLMIQKLDSDVFIQIEKIDTTLIPVKDGEVFFTIEG